MSLCSDRAALPSVWLASRRCLMDLNPRRSDHGPAIPSLDARHGLPTDSTGKPLLLSMSKTLLIALIFALETPPCPPQVHTQDPSKSYSNHSNLGCTVKHLTHTSA